MNKTQATAYTKQVSKECLATRRFLQSFEQFDSNNDLACFDNLAVNSEAPAVPEALQELLNSPSFADDNAKQAIFDGLHDGINEYKKLNNGRMPSADIVYSALLQAKETDPNLRNESSPAYDSLSFGHHESLSVVPTSVQVVLSHAIANSLPLIAMLPNPTGSNEVPLVHGEVTTGSNIGMMRKGDLIDGVNAGLPYIDNNHTLTMNDDGGGNFSLTTYHAYKEEKRANGSIKFVVDDTSVKAPFIAGRVVVLVKGVEVANDKFANHATSSGISTLQPVGKVTIGADSYLVKTATADLDTHTINVEFDSAETVPTGDEVEVKIVFDYDRKDNKGNKILSVPDNDMSFKPYSIFAYPIRALSSASIDSITQLQNEMGISWYASVQMIFINKFNIEQNARLLREAMNICLNNNDHIVTFDADKTNVSFPTLKDMFASIKISLGKARNKLSHLVNLPIAGYDIYVSDKGSEFLDGLDGNEYTPTGTSFGNHGSIYQIGTMRNGSRVFYVPPSMKVFNEENLTNGAYMMLIPQYTTPSKAPFVGTVAVPFMPRKSNKDAFEEDGGIYGRAGAEINPIPRYSKQFMLLELINLPAL